ncbi:MAG TPA: toll/interleukin-1 receptor domain-containing protein [Candidatus Binatia bacterium]|nr:toll/interleukin-1 receptor domain-containing protein [Candidatus Binatia bacterium]
MTTPPAPPRFDVFLSHRSVDKPAVEAIGARLRRDGFAPFLDAWNLVPGMPWQQELADALGHSACAAVFFGPGAPGPWHSEEMQVALNRAVRTRDDYRVIPVLLPGSDPAAVSGFLETRTWVDFRPGLDDAEAYARLVAGIQGRAPDTARHELPDEPRPYRGLERFEHHHREFFHGRDEDIGRLAARLRADHFVAVVGASGSGKSSLVRAGLGTEAAERALPGLPGWRRLYVIPGHDPLRALVDQIRMLGPGPAAGQADPVDWVDRQTERLRQREDGLLTLVATLAGAEPVLLVIDQLEEVFTHRPPPERDAAWREGAACLAANLLAAATAQPPQLRMVATVRADFITRFVGEDFPAFRQLLERRQLWLGPMSEEDLRAAIVLPARRRGAFFEKGLVEMILRDMRGHATALPLLEEALAVLWAARRGPWLTLDAYARSGGVGGALAASADALYEPLDASARRLARRIFLGLIHLGEGVPDTRRRVPVSSVLGATDPGEEVEALLRRFSSTEGARLITLSSADGAVTAEITHEALILHWARLRRWIDESRGDLRLLRRLDAAAAHWQELGRPDGSLWRPPDLTLLETYAAAAPDGLTQTQAEFYAASRRGEDDRQAERAAQVEREISAARQLAAAEARENAAKTRHTEEARAKVRFRRMAAVAGLLAVIAVAVAGVALHFRQVAAQYARDLLSDQIERYERIPTALSGLATPPLPDGYPFSDKPWARAEHARVLGALGAAPAVGTPAVLQSWDRVREQLPSWDPEDPARLAPDPQLQEAARDLARAFKAMWDEDTGPDSPMRSLRAIEGSPPFLDKRRRAYDKDRRALTSLISARALTESAAVRQGYRDFWALYWGELLIVEDPRTLRLMIQVGGRLARDADSWVSTGRKPADFDPVAGELVAHLEAQLAVR